MEDSLTFDAMIEFTEPNLQPYYDDDREPICDTDDDDDDESGDEIVMVNRGGALRGGDSDSN